MKNKKNSASEAGIRFVKKVRRTLADFFSKIFVSPRMFHLSHQIQMLQLSLDGKEKIIKLLETEKLEMASQYQRLDEKLRTIEAETRDREREAFFHTLQTTLVQITVLGADLKNGVQIPIEELIYILETIPDKLSNFGIEQYLKVGQLAEFDPREHTPVLSEAGQLKDGDKVISVVPGFKYKEAVLLRAEVRKMEA